MSAAKHGTVVGHVGLYVRDFDGMTEFYRKVLGFVLTDQGERIRFFSRDPTQHHQVVLCPGRPENSPEAIQQLSFKVGTLEEVKEIYENLVAAKVTGIDPRTHGNAWSVYFRDPENNRLEFYCDTPWHIPQPFGRKIDLTLPVERIYAETKAMCEATPGFKPMPQFETELAGRIDRAE
jgi:catechol 2,3-dioxygenase